MPNVITASALDGMLSSPKVKVKGKVPIESILEEEEWTLLLYVCFSLVVLCMTVEHVV